MKHHWGLWLSVLFTSAILNVTASCERRTKAFCKLPSEISHRAEDHGGIEAYRYSCPDNETLSMIRIRVEDLVGRQIMLKVKRSSQVGQLKAAIEAKLTPANGLVLVHSGRQLGWSLTLDHYSIQPDDRILIFHQIRGGGSKTIKGMIGKITTFSRDSSFSVTIKRNGVSREMNNITRKMSVESLRKKFEIQAQINATKLFFKRNLMSDTETLGSYNITGGAELTTNIILIHVKYEYLNKDVKCNITNYDCERQVKSLIAEVKSQCNWNILTLYFYSKKLDENRELSSYSIIEGDILGTNTIYINMIINGKDYIIEHIDRELTVESLRRETFIQTKIAPKKLFLGRKLLDQKVILSRCSITDGVTLTTDNIQITIVFNENEPDDNCTIDNNDCDCSVKSLIEKVVALCNSSKPKLSFKGMSLDQNQTLSSYNIIEGDVLNANFITIYIYNNGTNYRINRIDQDLIVESLCKEITNRNEIVPLKLFFRNQLLDQNITLSSCNIDDGAMLSTGIMKITIKLNEHVRNPEGKCEIYDTDCDWSVKSLIEKGAEQCKWDITNLFSNGELMDQEQKLISYNVTEGGVLTAGIIDITIKRNRNASVYSGCQMKKIDSAWSVKTLIEKVVQQCKWDISKLYYKENLLDQEKTLRRYNIIDGYTLTAGVIKIYIYINVYEYFPKKCEMYYADYDWSLKSLIEKVAEQCKWNTSKLFFRGDLLDQDKTLRSCKINEGSSLTTNLILITLRNNGVECNFYIDKDFTVESLCTKVTEKCDINPAKILFGGKLLDQDKTLSSYNIGHDAIIETNIKQIILHNNGTKFTLSDINHDCTVESLHTEIGKQCKINPATLLFRGQLLNQNETLSIYNIEDGNAISTNIVSIDIRICGETFTFYDIDIYSSVTSLHAKVTEQCGVTQPELYKNKKLMKSNNTLLDCGITDDVILNTGNCIYLRFNGMMKPIINLDSTIRQVDIIDRANQNYGRLGRFTSLYRNNENAKYYILRPGDVLTTNLIQIYINVNGKTCTVQNVNLNLPVQSLYDKVLTVCHNDTDLYLGEEFLKPYKPLANYNIFEGTFLSTSKDYLGQFYYCDYCDEMHIYY